jgi:XTP/dITP diphosphohydrolase
LDGLPVRFASLEDFPDLPRPDENADTFEGNAAIKALHYARLTAQWTLADDSGLTVDALNSEPGVRSARYAGPECDPAANNAKLVKALAAVSPDRRAARFCCAIVLAGPQGILATAEGVVEGIIIDEPRGHNGFGYDPHFFMPEYGMTTAQMSLEQKNRISHRGQALRRIRPAIERLLARPTET